MATVTGFTAERMLAIEQNTIVSARREGSDLILTTFGGVEINLGNVNGRGVQSTTVAYQISTSASDTPIGPWFTEMPQLLPGYYLWTKTTMTYTDNTSTPMYTVARIGQDGNAGSPPRTPNNLTVVSNTGFFDNTGAVALIVLSWDPVDMGLDAEGLEIASYEVFGGGSRFISAVTEPVIGLTVPSGKVDQYQVRALSTTGLYGDLTVPIEVTAATPASTTRQPTPPTLSSAMSTVVAKWDGSYLSGGLAGAHTVVVEIQNGSDWVQQGTALTSAGSVSFNAVVGSTVSVRLRAYDQLQRLTGTSATATVTVLGVALQDIDQAFNDALSDTIVGFQEEYATSNDPQTVPTMGWTTVAPPWVDGQYVWKRTKVTNQGGGTGYSDPVLTTGQSGEDAVLVRIFSSKGTAFKNSAISTVLTVTVFKGSQQITNITDLWSLIGPSAYLEWWWRRIDDSDFGVISFSDSRLSNAGFTFTVSPSDVDEQTVFQCILHT